MKEDTAVNFWMTQETDALSRSVVFRDSSCIDGGAICMVGVYAKVNRYYSSYAGPYVI